MMQARFVLSVLLSLSIAFTTCTDKPTESEDKIGPLSITDLAIVGEVDTNAVLEWTAPADDREDGAVVAYDIRYATDSLVLLNWTDAQQVPDPPEPDEPGTVEQFEITGLTFDAVYYFGVRSIDNADNLSGPSNMTWLAHSEIPQVIIISPAQGQGVADLVDIEALARDDKGVSHVAFYVDSDLLSVDYNAPYTARWDAHLEFNFSEHIIYAEVADSENNQSVSVSHVVTIDPIVARPPIPEILSLNQSDTGVIMTWGSCQANDYDHYEIRWDTLSIIIALRNNAQVADRYDTTLFITLECDHTEYFFTVAAYDQFGHFGRNDTAITTGDKLPPPSEITHLIKLSDTLVRIIWDGTEILDFLEYNLYRSSDQIFDQGDLLLHTATNLEDTTFTDNLPAGIMAYYFVQISDLTGHTELSAPYGTNQIETIGSEWALEFDGSNDYVQIPSNINWLGSSERTVEMWVYPYTTNYPRHGMVISADLHSWELDIKTTYDHHYYSGDCHLVVPGEMIPTNTWTHVAWLSNWKEGFLKFYVNGDLVDSMDCYSTPTPWQPIFLGSRADDNEYNFLGIIDEVRFWNYNRSDEEISANYNVTISDIPEGLVGYWPFEEGYGSQTWMGVGPDATLGKKNGSDTDDPTWIQIDR